MNKHRIHISIIFIIVLLSSSLCYGCWRYAGSFVSGAYDGAYQRAAYDGTLTQEDIAYRNYVLAERQRQIEYQRQIRAQQYIDYQIRMQQQQQRYYNNR